MRGWVGENSVTALTHSLSLTHSQCTAAFVRSFVRSFVHSVRSFVRSFTAFVHSVRSCVLQFLSRCQPASQRSAALPCVVVRCRITALPCVAVRCVALCCAAFVVSCGSRSVTVVASLCLCCVVLKSGWLAGMASSACLAGVLGELVGVARKKFWDWNEVPG